MSDPYRIPPLVWVVFVPFILLNFAVMSGVVTGVIPDVLRLVLGLVSAIMLTVSYLQHRKRSKR